MNSQQISLKIVDYLRVDPSGAAQDSLYRLTDALSAANRQFGYHIMRPFFEASPHVD